MPKKKVIRSPQSSIDLLTHFDDLTTGLRDTLSGLQDRANSLYSSSERLNRATSMQDVLDAIVQGTVISNLDRASLLLFNRPWIDEKPEILTVMALWEHDGTTGTDPVGSQYQINTFALINIMQRDQPTIFNDVATDSRFEPSIRDYLVNVMGMRGFMVFPLSVGEQWLGYISVQTAEAVEIADTDLRQVMTLTSQASTVVQTLRLLEQTQKRALELETVAKVSAAAATILNMDDLLKNVSDLTKEAFNLYHAHIYLLDEAGENLTLANGAGDAGRQMKEKGYNIPLDREHSLVASAARTRSGVIANDVTKTDNFLPNPLLPDTQSEMAIPLLVGDRVVGVLDVQASTTNNFSQDDVRIYTALADQVAVAVENARAFGRVEAAREEVSRVYDLSVDMIGHAGFDGYFKNLNPAWERILGWSMQELLSKPFVEFVHPDDRQRTLDEYASEMAAGKQTISFENRYACKDGSYKWISWNAVPFASEGMTYFVARDVTANKAVESERQLMFTAASALTNARTAADVLAAVLPYSRDKGAYTASLLYIDSDKDNVPEWAITVAEWSINNQATTPVGSRFYLPEFLFAKLWMSNPNEPVFIENVATDKNVDDMTRNIMMQTGGHALALMPLTSQGRWIAILTFSWHQPTQFSDDDRRIYTGMMQQAIPTVDALRSAEETQIAREDAETLYRVSSLINEAQNEQDIINAIVQHTVPEAITSVSLSLNEGGDYETAKYIEIVANWQRDGMSAVGMRIPTEGFNNDFNNPRVMSVINDVKTETPEMVHAAYEALNVTSIISMPLFLGGRLIGSLGLSGPKAYYFSKREIQMWRAIAEQAATTMERLFLSRQTNRRAAEMETVAQVSAATTSILDVNEMLLAVSNLTKERFGLYHAHFYLLDEAGENLVLAEGAGEAGRIMKEEGRSIPINHPNSLVARAASSRKGAIANDVTKAADFLENPFLPDTKSEMAVPMIVGDKLVGVLDVQSDITNRFSEDDVRIQSTLADQIAVAVENARAFAERTLQAALLELQASELSTVAQVSTEATTNLNVESLLWSVADLTKERFNRYHVHVYLLDENGKDLTLTASAGEVGRQLVAQDHHIPIDREQSLVARAARTRQGFIVNDVHADPNFMANKLLPETKSEMALPMVVGDKVVGVLDIQDNKVNAFRDEQLKIKQIMANQIATAVENARAFTRITAANDEVSRIYNMSVDMIGYAGFDGFFKSLNPAWEKTLGWNMEELTSKPFIEFVHPEDRQRTLDEYAAAMAAGKSSITFENRYQSKDGSYRWLSWNAVPYIQENMTYFVTRDITNEKEDEAQREIIFETASRLNEARERADVLESMLAFVKPKGIVSGSLLYIEVDQNNKPEWAEVAAEWTVTGAPSTPPGTRYYLPEFPIADLWMSSPNEPLLIEDINDDTIKDDVTRALMKQIGTQSMALLPMVSQGSWVAIGIFSWAEAHHFSEQDRRIYTSIMQQATATVDALRSAEETKQAREDAETLYSVSTLINEARIEQDIVNAIIQHAIPDAINSVSLNLNEGSDYQKATYVEVVGSWRRDGTSNVGLRIPLAGFNNDTGAQNTMVVINDVKAQLPAEAAAAYEMYGVNAIVTIPLFIGGRLTGSLSLSSSTAYRFSQRELQMWRAIAEQSATTMERLFLTGQTNRRAAEMETVAQVSAATTSILDMNEMLLAVSNLTKERFGLYHAHVYLLDEAGENLVLAAGAGEPGRIMKEQGRSISIKHPNSLVARAASSRKGAIANDVTEAPDFLANPLLPDTKSEMAVPMIVGKTLVGVLDVQSDITNRFSEDDVRIQSTLADQIAVAVENSRAFARIQQTEKAVREREQRYQNILDSVSDLILVKGEKSSIQWANKAFREYYGMNQDELQGMIDAPTAEPDYTQKYIQDDTYVFEQGLSLEIPEEPIKRHDGEVRLFQTVKTPIFNENGEVFLTVGVSRDITERKQQEAVEQVLYEVSRELSNAKDSADVLNAMSSYLATRSGSSASLFHIDTEDDIPTWLETAATRSNTPEGAASIGSRYYLPEFTFSKIWMSNPNQPVLIGDMETLRESDPPSYAVFKGFGISATAIIPLYSQNKWLGLITMSWTEATDFNDNDERILTAIMRQATSKVDALRAAEMTAKRATELQTVAQVSAAATMILDSDALLQSVVDLTKESFGLYHAHVYLLDEAGENLVLAAGAGEPGRIMKEQGRSISLTHQNSLVARAARNRDGAIANNVTQAADFLPNPLLPETKSEMAIPLIVGDEVIGVLDVQANTINRFTASDVTIQSTLADQIAVAVQNARAFKITQETAERLREVDRLKSQFLANMSHELRTPLNSIIGYAEVLLDGIDGELGDEAIEDVEAIHGGGKHLLTIINDILDLAKIEAGQMFMDRQEAKLTQVIDEVVGTCQILAKNKDISLNVEIDNDIPTVFGDSIRLKQIIFNLVNNAIKFTEKGGVTVNVDMMNDNNEVVVSINDTGMGMTEEDIGGLFQQFHQVDGSATRRAGGTGLGLVITRHLVHMHGGEIFVESAKGEGSTFSFTLPVYANQPRQKA